MLGEAEMAAAKKLSENEARVTELTDRWKDRWKETQKILEVCTCARIEPFFVRAPPRFTAKISGLQGTLMAPFHALSKYFDPAVL